MADRSRRLAAPAATPDTARSQDARARRAVGEPPAAEPALTPPGPLPSLARQLAQVIPPQPKPRTMTLSVGRRPVSRGPIRSSGGRPADSAASVAMEPRSAARTNAGQIRWPTDVMRMAQPSSPAIQRKCARCAMDDEEGAELKHEDNNSGSASLDTRQATRGADAAASRCRPACVRSSSRLRPRLQRLRLRADAEAGRAARAVQARA